MTTKTIKKTDNIVLLGGGKFSLELIGQVKALGYDVQLLSSPRRLEETIDELTLEDHLKRLKIDYVSVEKMNTPSETKDLKFKENTFFLSLGAPWIIKKETIKNLFNNNLFNLHGTRLPQNRGGGGFSWQIMMGNRLGFCQLHEIDGGIDTGDIVRTKEFIYPPSCKLPSQFQFSYLKENLKFTESFFKELREQNVEYTPTSQPEYMSSYWPRLNTELQSWISWDLSTIELERFICAFDDPYSGAQTYLGDQQVSIKKAQGDYNDQHFHSFQNGIVYRNNGEWLSVCTNSGSLLIEQVFNEQGENILPNIQVGDRFYTPTEKLDQAKAKRVIYTPKGLKE